MSELQDQFLQLPHLTWRGIILPISDRSHRFAHEGTDHQVIYRDGVAVEMTGAGGSVFSYTLPMREGITKGPYGGLFSRTLIEFYKSYHDDKSPGELYDPIYGLLTCVPQEWDETTDISKRDGVDVRVSFKVHTPDDGTGAAASPSLDSLQTDAQRLDEEVKTVPWITHQLPPPDATTDPFSAVAGVMQQGNFAVSRVKATCHDVAYRMSEVEDAASEAEKNGMPGAGYIRRDARSARLKATRVAEAPPRKMASQVVQETMSAPKDLLRAAMGLGLTVQEFLELNAELSREVVIPTGTKVWRRK